MPQIDLKLLKSNRPDVADCALSMSYGNAHIVIMLEGPDKIREAIQLLRTAPPIESVWMDGFGKFGDYPASVYVSKDSVSFVVDGDECVDGSGQSFALYIPRTRMSELIDALQAVVQA